MVDNEICLHSKLIKSYFCIILQRSWFDARALCKAKGLKFLDLDPIWDDAPTVVEIIERFLKATSKASSLYNSSTLVP